MPSAYNAAMKAPRTLSLSFPLICGLTSAYLFCACVQAAPPARPSAPTPLEQQQEKALEQSLKKFVRHHVRAHAQYQFDEGAPLAPDIRIDKRHLRRSLHGKPPCLVPKFFLPETTLRPRLSVILRCQHSASKAANKSVEHGRTVFWTVYVPVNLRLPGTYPVAARPLAPNHTIAKADVRLHRGDLLRLAPDAIINPKNVLQHTTTQRIGARQPFKHNALRHPHTVLRGQTLTLQIRGANYTISTTGTALQTGKIGNQIQARNAAGLTVQGRLIDAHTLVVDAATG